MRDQQEQLAISQAAASTSQSNSDLKVPIFGCSEMVRTQSCQMMSYLLVLAERGLRAQLSFLVHTMFYLRVDRSFIDVVLLFGREGSQCRRSLWMGRDAVKSCPVVIDN